MMTVADILEKYPPPWKLDDDGLVSDANDIPVAEGHLRLGERYDDCVERLVLAAPQLLDVVKALVHNEEMDAGGTRLPSPAALFGRAIIERIEKGAR